jgi:hypothetical protein
MADNYTHAAFTFATATPEQAEQLTKWLSGKELPEALKTMIRETNPDAIDDDGEVRLTIAGAAEHERENEVYANVEGEGDLDLIAVTLSYAMSIWPDVPSPQGFEWANSCSAMRAGEFGGGAVVIKRDAPNEWLNTSSWLDDKINGRRANRA